MPLRVRLFVTGVFLLVGLSFVAPTAVLIYEFASTTWLTLATFYSHLFVFFPTLGVVTLFAFYTPACVFTDMYWRHVRLGRTRFVLGLAIVSALSIAAAYALGSGRERSIFEVSPQVLASDRGEPANCAAGNACTRVSVLEAAGSVRAVSQSRMGLTDLARNCRADPLIEAPSPTVHRKRFCFTSTPLSAGTLASDGDCCRSQAEFADALRSMYEPREQRSLTGLVHHAVLPGKIFFMLILLVISVLLAARRRSLERYYSQHLKGIERGVLIGAAAMVIYPIMSHAFLQSAVLLYGEASGLGYRAVAPYLTALFGAWALLLLFFFFKRRDQDLQLLGRLAGAVGGVVAVLKYDLIIDVFVRIFGSGAPGIMLVAVAASAVLAVILLFRRTTEEMADTAAPRSSAEPALRL